MALTENLVFGKIAGENAALYIKANKKGIEMDDEYRITLESSYAEEYENITQRLKQILSSTVGIVRNQEGLLEGLEEVQNIRARLKSREKETEDFAYDSSHIQAQSLALISYCIIQSCLMREESRDTHFRKDYPRESKAFVKQIVI